MFFRGPVTWNSAVSRSYLHVNRGKGSTPVTTLHRVSQYVLIVARCETLNAFCCLLRASRDADCCITRHSALSGCATRKRGRRRQKPGLKHQPCSEGLGHHTPPIQRLRCETHEHRMLQLVAQASNTNLPVEPAVLDKEET
jgi:hypothetical protein